MTQSMNDEGKYAGRLLRKISLFLEIHMKRWCFLLLEAVLTRLEDWNCTGRLVTTRKPSLKIRVNILRTAEWNNEEDLDPDDATEQLK